MFNTDPAKETLDAITEKLIAFAVRCIAGLV
jgi:hypothetical protein